METLTLNIYFKDGTKEAFAGVTEYNWACNGLFLWVKYNKKAINKKESSGFTSDQRWFDVKNIDHMEASSFQSTT